MSTGMTPVRGALFAFVVTLLSAGAGTTESRVSGTGTGRGNGSSSGNGETPFRLRWLSDPGAESSSTERAAGRSRPSVGIARVPGALYVLALDGSGAVRREQRIEADFSMRYGLASVGTDAVVAADDGSISLWSDLAASPPSLRWRNDLGDRAASVAWDGGDLVFVATRKNQLVAFSAVDGTTVWSANIGGRAEAPAVRDKDALFVATKGQTLLRLDPSNGKLKWKAELSGPVNDPPVLAGENPRLVVCGTWNGDLQAFDPGTGKPIWSVDLESRLAGPLVAGESYTAVATDDGAVRAFDLEGRLLWNQQAVVQGSTPADVLLQRAEGGGPRLVVVSNVLKSLDPATGELLGEYPADAATEIERRFAGALLDGERAYSENEKESLRAREAFSLQGRLFGNALLQGAGAGDLLFGTEEGWMYWFDAASLRPLCRYRAGQRASGDVLATKRAVVASASEAVFALDPGSGRPMWARDLGAVRQIAAGAAVAVVADDRVDVLDADTGSRQWSLRGEFESVASLGDSWVAFGRDGTVQVLDSAGTDRGAAFEAGGPIEHAASLGERGWVTSTKDGSVAALTWEDALRPLWQTTVGEPVETLGFAGETVVVATSHRLVGLAVSDGSVAWETPLAEGEKLLSSGAGGGAAFVLVVGAGELRAHDPGTGVVLARRAVTSNVIGATVRDEEIVWLDESGRAHRTPAVGEVESPEQTVDLGVRLRRAASTDGGFLVTTAAGEVGLVEIVDSVGTEATARN